MLSKREHQVLSHLASGQTPKRVSEALGVSLPVVSNAVRSMSGKVPGLGPALALIRDVHRQQARARE